MTTYTREFKMSGEQQTPHQELEKEGPKPQKHAYQRKQIIHAMRLLFRTTGSGSP